MKSPVSSTMPNRALVQMGLDVLGGAAGERDLDVVDRRGAVHHEVGQEPALDERDQTRGDADLDHVSAAHREHRPAGLARGDRALDHLAQRLGRELARQGREHRLGVSRIERTGEILDRDLGRAIGNSTHGEP